MSDTPSTAVFAPNRFVTLVRRIAISTGFFFRFFAPSAMKISADGAASFAYGFDIGLESPASAFAAGAGVPLAGGTDSAAGAGAGGGADASLVVVASSADIRDPSS